MLTEYILVVIAISLSMKVWVDFPVKEAGPMPKVMAAVMITLCFVLLYLGHFMRGV